ncbi:MAG TPA: galactose-1-phosphate uridylyltransferase [Candidatus Binatia bacterium]|nr:galactose-1-phosphate uridylyltransferase [Candidatus Binatia bacterium]
MPELRKDPVLARWVIIATERVLRLADLRFPRAPRHGGPCAFCPGHEHETPPELLAYRDAPTPAPDSPGWRVRVVPNKFPALRLEGQLERRGHGLYDLMTGIGAHEVVVESPDHDRDLGALPLAALEDVVRAYRDRLLELRRDDRLRAAVIFKTHGLAAGAGLEHPHSQVLATPILPTILGEEMQQARAYHDYRERCLFCDIVQQEIDDGRRLVTGGEHMLAFAPFASRAPFETWIVPRRHAAAFESAWAAEQQDLARVLHAVLAALDRLLDDPPFTLLVHTAPFAETDSPSYHWHIEVTPQLLPRTGFASGSGLHVNPLPPEDAARFLRDVAR